jgi:catechol 2,3-dioxygenase-like lactoylglutathione lyase family enzyme
VQINGLAHVQLSVTDLARSRTFWRPLCQLFEMTVLLDNEQVFYAIGGRTGVCLTPVDAAHREDRFVQRRVGLHHMCFRLRSREDIDELHRVLVAANVTIVHAPEDGPWAPGYYSVLFEDPDGIRVEANFVPGKGHLTDPSKLPKATLEPDA